MKRSEIVRKEKKIFLEIWNERSHSCIECSRKISRPSAINFSHYLSKGAFPELRFEKKNIDILCSDCHFRFEFNDRKNMKIYSEERTTELKQLANKLRK